MSAIPVRARATAGSARCQTGSPSPARTEYREPAEHNREDVEEQDPGRECRRADTEDAHRHDPAVPKLPFQRRPDSERHADAVVMRKPKKPRKREGEALRTRATVCPCDERRSRAARRRAPSRGTGRRRAVEVVLRSDGRDRLRGRRASPRGGAVPHSPAQYRREKTPNEMSRSSSRSTARRRATKSARPRAHWPARPRSPWG